MLQGGEDEKKKDAFHIPFITTTQDRHSPVARETLDGTPIDASRHSYGVKKMGKIISQSWTEFDPRQEEEAAGGVNGEGQIKFWG